VYEVCPLAAYGTGRVVVDQVVRLDCLPGDPQEPVFPALGGLGGLVGVQQVFPAQGAPSVLPGQQADGVGIQWGFHLPAALRPVPGQGGVIGGCPAFDQGMPHDGGPGQSRQVGAGVFIAEYPPVIPGLFELPELALALPRGPPNAPLLTPGGLFIDGLSQPLSQLRRLRRSAMN